MYHTGDQWGNLKNEVLETDVKCPGGGPDTSINPQLAYNLYILHNAHKYGPMETTMTLTHSIHYIKQRNTLENYYFQFFRQHNMIIKKKCPQKISYSH